MVDINALRTDLESIKPMLVKAEREGLLKVKDLCDKLNNQKFDEVIHELFSKDDILEFLSTTSITANMVVEKEVIKNAVKEATANFQKGVLSKIFELSEPDRAAMGSLLEKHGIEFDEEGEFSSNTDPIVVKLFEDLDNESGGVESHYSTLQSGSVKAATSYTKEVMTITHDCSDIQNPIRAEIVSSDLDVWTAEHFLVKDVDGQPGMATFELVY